MDRSKKINVVTLGLRNFKQSWNYSSTLAHREDIFEAQSKSKE